MGLAVGGMIHVFATVLGLSAIFKYSPTLYTIVKLIGAAYLIYLGYCYWKDSNLINKNEEEDVKSKTKVKPLMTIFKESILVEVTNPKTAQIIQERVSSSILFGMGSYIVVDEALEINR